MDFTIVAASKINPSYREFCELNYPGRSQHFYKRLEDQVSEGCFCESCQGPALHKSLVAIPRKPCRVKEQTC